jgi:hypothetical protein
MEMNVEKIWGCENLEVTDPSTSMLDQKHVKNVEHFKYSGCMITNDARCTREIAMAKAALTSILG